VQQHNGNIHLSIPIVHCPHEGNLREYGIALESYTLFKICGDLKVTRLLGMRYD